MSVSKRLIALLAVLALVVCLPVATAGVAIASPTMTPSERTAHAAIQTTQSTTSDSPTLPAELDGVEGLRGLDAATGANIDRVTIGSTSVVDTVGAMNGLLERAAETVPSTPELLLVAGIGNTRRSASSAVEHQTRRQLYESVRSSPGINLDELAAQHDLSVSTVRYHARILEDNNVVSASRDVENRRIYPLGGVEPSIRTALDEEATGRILRAVERLEPVTVSTLAADLGLAASTVSYHLTRFDEEGLVTRERDGRNVYTTVTPAVASAIDTGDEGASPPLESETGRE